MNATPIDEWAVVGADRVEKCKERRHRTIEKLLNIRGLAECLDSAPATNLVKRGYGFWRVVSADEKDCILEEDEVCLPIANTWNDHACFHRFKRFDSH
jgi:hypothetical protein